VHTGFSRHAQGQVLLDRENPGTDPAPLVPRYAQGQSRNFARCLMRRFGPRCGPTSSWRGQAFPRMKS